MNFLAHHVIATQYLSPPAPLSFYVAGNALPDLLPLAAPRLRFRPPVIERAPLGTGQEAALRAGAAVHLATDAAFHKTAAFAAAQAEAAALLRQAGFAGIRVRVFFLAHILAELALDAALLRADIRLAGDFYDAFAAADPIAVATWAEATLQTPLSALPGVLNRFAVVPNRYLYYYADDEGVAEGISRLCARARQDTFAGENFLRLTACVARAVQALTPRVSGLLQETAATMAGANNR